ncbi:hypothetical protein A3860_22290 [Niastella vici]|uniref:Uncharacterized protein n=1 Tax=Niastella vici TaxID=1703345 RepID=A0A1V9G0U2_9BACT|nr:hypothetical protein [Niastella vici]OQP64138.1 hypothetical protein A3860_22290 [Niastella vici]
MRHKTLLQYCFLLYILFAAACSEPEKPVTKEEAAAMAKSLKTNIAHRKSNWFNEVLDIKAFESRIREAAHNKVNETMLKGAMKSIESGDFGEQVIKALGKRGSYELVKQYEKNNHQHLVFRMYNEQLNYHDFELIKKGDKIKIADIFIYTTGENLSASIGESLMSMNEQLSAVSKVDPQELQKIQLIKSYMQRKDGEKASELYKSLPGLLRAQKLYKIMYIQIASDLGNDEYLAALNKFQQEYPDAPNMYLLMIDAYFLKKDFPGALRCVNSLDSLINKDPFLDFYRAVIYKQNNDPANALVCLEKLHQYMPDFGTGTLQLINAYLDEKQLDKAVALTQSYKKGKDVDDQTLEALYLMYPGYKKKMETTTE